MNPEPNSHYESPTGIKRFLGLQLATIMEPLQGSAFFNR